MRQENRRLLQSPGRRVPFRHQAHPPANQRTATRIQAFGPLSREISVDCPERDPDLRVREALALVFRKFVELQSVRQVHLWFRQERIALPAVHHGPEGRRLQWKAPVYNTILHILTNPIYAGAYAYGRW